MVILQWFRLDAVKFLGGCIFVYFCCFSFSGRTFSIVVFCFDPHSRACYECLVMDDGIVPGTAVGFFHFLRFDLFGFRFSR